MAKVYHFQLLKYSRYVYIYEKNYALESIVRSAQIYTRDELCCSSDSSIFFCYSVQAVLKNYVFALTSKNDALLMFSPKDNTRTNILL